MKIYDLRDETCLLYNLFGFLSAGTVDSWDGPYTLSWICIIIQNWYRNTHYWIALWGPNSECNKKQSSLSSVSTEHHTFNALILFPIVIAIHSPGAVECPVGIVIPAICGDHARLEISLWPVYAMTGSATTRFLTSGRGELSPELAFRGEAAGTCMYGTMSQSRSWQSSAGGRISVVSFIILRKREEGVPTVASNGLSVELHPRAFTGALWACSSMTGCPGLRMSRIWMSCPS